MARTGLCRAVCLLPVGSCINIGAWRVAEPHVKSTETESLPTRGASAPMSLLFGYGYESTETLVWDAAAKRFISVFSCC